MKYAILLVFIVLLNGCGYKDVQMAYQESQRMAIEAHYSQEKQNLLELELDNEGRIKKITIGDPYMAMQGPPNVKSPAPHPAYGLTGQIVNSPVLSILGGGWAARELVRASGDTITGSYNKGDGGVSINGDTAGYNTNTDAGDYSDQSDNRENYNNTMDQSDNRENYNNTIEE